MIRTDNVWRAEAYQLTGGASLNPLMAEKTAPPRQPIVKAPPQSSVILYGLKYCQHVSIKCAVI